MFVSLQQITFKLGNFTDFKMFFPAVFRRIFGNWSQSKADLIVEVSFLPLDKVIS